MKNEENIENIKKQIEECQKVRDEYLAGWQRAKADILNYKKGETERIGQIVRYAMEEFMLKIFPILDNFERAEAGMPDNLKQDQYVKGLLQVKSQILDLLKSFEIEEIPAIGQNFDPNFHEVVEQLEVTGEQEGTIKEVIEKGYVLQGKVLRPAKVKIVK